MVEHTLTFIVKSTDRPENQSFSDRGDEAMWKLPVGVILAALTAVALILAFLVRLAIRSHTSGGETGASPMIGLKGKAVTEVAPEGRVIVQGEYWWARSQMKIAEGEYVRVVGMDGLTLEIEACPDKALIPRPVSAIEGWEVHKT
jgi:membrane-bound ClpP family serine protease